MPQDTSATPRKGKTRANDYNQPPNEPATAPTMETPAPATDKHQDTMAQLKKAILDKGGLIKNATDTRKHLDAMGLSPSSMKISPGNIAEILLTLVVTTATRRTASEKIPEKIANIIKAAALTLEDITANDTDTRRTEPETGTDHENTPQNPIHQEIRDQLEENANLFKQAAKNQADATNKANALLARMEKMCEQTEKSLSEAINTTKEAAKPATPYRDALLNGRSNITPQTPSQQRILNRINIKSRQVLTEFKADAHKQLDKTDQLHAKSINLAIKEAINTWLNAPEDQFRPLPNNVIARTIVIYGNNRMMIELNTNEAATWMQTHLQ
jgi:hypothetical protein